MSTRHERLVAALDGRLCDPGLPALADPAAWRKEAAAALAKLPLDGPQGEGLLEVAEGVMGEGLVVSPGRSVLVGELACNLADPGRINQGHKGTCAATCLESWLAESMPDEYARLIAGLASISGMVELKSGEILTRDEETLVWSEDEARRSPVSRLFQAACMELAYPELDYCNITDKQRNAEGEEAGYGLQLEAFDRLLEVVTGQRWDMISDLYSKLLDMLGMNDTTLPDIRRDGRSIMEKSFAAGQPMFATLDLKGAVWEGQVLEAGHVTHKVRLVDIEDDRVIFDDPLNPEVPWLSCVETVLINEQGRASMMVDELLERAVELSYQPRFWDGGAG